MTRVSVPRWLEPVGLGLLVFAWFFLRKNAYGVAAMLVAAVVLVAYMIWRAVAAARQQDARQEAIIYLVAAAVLAGFAAVLGDRLSGLM